MAGEHGEGSGAPTGRPPATKLKISINTNGHSNPLSASTPFTTTPGGSRPLIKFKNSPSVPGTPAPASLAASKPKKTKAGRAPKPTAKAIENRKRKDGSEEEEQKPILSVEPPKKRIRLQIGPQSAKPGGLASTTPKTPLILKAKLKGKIPERPPGTGYDSEAEDKEDDPAIEEQFILRMQPGADCDYLRQIIAEKKIGVAGSDVSMKFFTGDGRRAMVSIRGHVYAATLVDLPCIIEGMKSWDKRGWWKSADICQMLWVFAQVNSEAEAKIAPLPAEVDKETHQYPHGLTPPMYFARERRFRKRLHKTQIEAVEAAVERLLDEDSRAINSHYVIFDPDAERQQSQALSPRDYDEDGEEYSQDEDAEGEEDDIDDGGYFGQEHQNGNYNQEAPPDMDMDGELDLEAELEAAMQNGGLENELFEAPTPMAETPAPAPAEEEEDSGDESIEDEEGEDDAAAQEADEAEQERLAQIQGVKEDISELEKKLVDVQEQIAQQRNPILKKRLEDNVRKLKAEIELKKSSIGEGEDED